MNEEVRERLTDSPTARIFHHTLYSALKAWGQQIEDYEIERVY